MCSSCDEIITNMLVINRNQANSFTNINKERFILKMIEIICSEFSDAKDIDKKAFAKSIDILILKAHGYGMDSERSLGLFILAGYLLGENFDTDFSSVQHFLNDKFLEEDVKAEALEKWTKLVFESLQNN